MRPPTIGRRPHFVHRAQRWVAILLLPGSRPVAMRETARPAMIDIPIEDFVFVVCALIGGGTKPPA